MFHVSHLTFQFIMIYRSKAPLRIGLAGGGTDVSPYTDLYGGAILNATISLYANATIEPISDNKIILEAIDRNEEQQFDWSNELPIDGKLDLLKGIYNRIQKDYGMGKMIKRVPACLPMWMPRQVQDWAPLLL